MFLYLYHINIIVDYEKEGPLKEAHFYVPEHSPNWRQLLLVERTDSDAENWALSMTTRNICIPSGIRRDDMWPWMSDW